METGEYLFNTLDLEPQPASVFRSTNFWEQNRTVQQRSSQRSCLVTQPAGCQDLCHDTELDGLQLGTVGAAQYCRLCCGSLWFDADGMGMRLSRFLFLLLLWRFQSFFSTIFWCLKLGSWGVNWLLSPSFLFRVPDGLTASKTLYRIQYRLLSVVGMVSIRFNPFVRRVQNTNYKRRVWEMGPTRWSTFILYTY